MAMTPIPAGTTQWDVPVNERFLELDQRLTQVGVDVTEYGALGNGATDDTDAIQAAIAAAPAGGTVYLPPTADGYLLDSDALSITTAGVTLRGVGGSSKLVLGANFTGATMVNITAADCGVIDLRFEGDNTTTTSNPAADAIRVIGVRRPRINRCSFFNINGWAIQFQSTSASATSNPDGGTIGQVYVSECAGGVRFFGDAAQSSRMNCTITDFQATSMGVASGASANLDAIMIEDARDVQIENVIAWMSAGTGPALHVKGDCVTILVTSFDGRGSTTNPCTLVESDAGGSPANVQITGAAFQQGTTGLRVTGTASDIRVTGARAVSNRTHGISIENTASPVYLGQVVFALNGQGASGSNYDLNWSGSAVGSVTASHFSSPITSVGVAGVQQSVNITAGQDVSFNAVKFAGTSAASTNWFTNLPDAVLLADSVFNFRTPVSFADVIASQPSASGNTALSTNVGNLDAFDRFRLLGSGAMSWGPGSGARDVTVARNAANRLDLTTADLRIASIGRGLEIAEGSNAKMGLATLVAGTVTVSTTAVAANSRIFLTAQSTGGTAGALRISARSAGTSFTITSTSGTDTSTVAWHIVGPA
jgi:hypothetical protein